ncbi:lamin tail domain-containing protein, partial [Agromyces seonyuensis]
SAPAAASPAAAPPPAEDESPALPPAEPADGPLAVVISEVANGTARSAKDSFFELRNVSDAEVDLTGWNVYRCNAMGLRPRLDGGEARFDGVVLASGATFTVARPGTLPDADALISHGFPASGFGLVLIDPGGARVDAVGVYPNEPWPTTSECTVGRNLPNSLAFALDESWQRVAVTGDAERDWVRARSTPGAPNAERAAAPATDAPDLRIEELAAAGVDDDEDDFVELVNRSAVPADVSGWRLYRCTASGRATSDTLMTEFAAGETLSPGERIVVAGPAFSGGDGRTVANPTSLAQTAFGALLVDAGGARVSGVAVSGHADSACQSGDAKLASVLDSRTGESWQVGADGEWVVAPRTPGRANTSTDTGLAHRASSTATAASLAGDSVAISEFAVDPAGVAAADDRHHFVELANYGQTPVDLSGWMLVRCGHDGFRDRGSLATAPPGTVLAPGATWIAAAPGTAESDRADARLSGEFDFRGAGVWVEDEHGRLVDRVGAFAQNEMDESVETPSACTNERSLTVFEVDRLEGETFRRTAFTGVDAEDFVAAPATPGVLDRVRFAVAVSPAAASGAEPVLSRHDVEETDAMIERNLAVRAARRTDLAVRQAWAGTSEGRLAVHAGEGEQQVAPDASPAAADDGYGFPYVRLIVDAPTGAAAGGANLVWSGTAAGRAGVALSAWDGAAWRLLAETIPAADGTVELAGRVGPADVEGGAVELLVQAGGRASTLEAGVADAFADPADYDLAISHLTDTQYLTEAYPAVYEQMVDWIVDNADERKIAFATHTGDLVQNWVDPDQEPGRARSEFALASGIQARLEAAGVPSSVLPGNHDSKRGVDYTLFNEAFPPSRYAGSPTWGGSIAPKDNRAHYDVLDADGACFLMLALPYAYGDAELAWARGVVTGHPQCNVVVSTHEHLQAKTLERDAHRSAASRWMSRADRLWEEVVAPNRNVVLVLSGHFHGLGRIVTPDAGGIEGHTVVELLADYQEFRTHTGERATGFQRLLQLDLAGGAVGVDTWSETLGERWSYPYDYGQFLRDSGQDDSFSTMRPWNIVERGTQGRYDETDDDFLVEQIAFQYPKSLATTGVSVIG